MTYKTTMRFPAFVLGLLLLSTPVFAASNAPQSVRFANSTFHDVLLTCPEQIWPGLDWSKLQMMFVSAESKQAWLVRAESSTPEALSFSNLPTEAHAEVFEIFPYRDKLTIAVNLEAFPDKGYEDPLAIAAHELFHEVNQKDWPALRSPKGDLFPFSTDARYLRFMLHQALQKYAKGDDEKLAEASFWFQRWQSEFPSENTISSDANEGTATYVEEVVKLMGKNGCASPLKEKELQKWITQKSFDLNGLQAEGYYMGATAAFLLERNQIEWKTRVEHGETPLEILLSQVPAKKMSDSKKTKAKIAKELTLQTADASAWIEAFESQWKNPNYVRVALPASWKDRAISYWGEFIPQKDLSHVYRIFNVDQEFKSPSQPEETLTLEESKMALDVDVKNSPCLASSTFFLIPKSKIKKNGEHFAANAEGVKLKLKGAIQISDGLPYLCTTP